MGRCAVAMVKSQNKTFCISLKNLQKAENPSLNATRTSTDKAVHNLDWPSKLPSHVASGHHENGLQAGGKGRSSTRRQNQHAALTHIRKKMYILTRINFIAFFFCLFFLLNHPNRLRLLNRCDAPTGQRRLSSPLLASLRCPCLLRRDQSRNCDRLHAGAHGKRCSRTDTCW